MDELEDSMKVEDESLDDNVEEISDPKVIKIWFSMLFIIGSD